MDRQPSGNGDRRSHQPSKNGHHAQFESAVTSPTLAEECDSRSSSGSERSERSQLDPFQKVLVWGLVQIVHKLAPDAKIDADTAAIVLGVKTAEVKKRARPKNGEPPRLRSQRGRKNRVIIPLADLLAYEQGDRQEGGAR